MDETQLGLMQMQMEKIIKRLAYDIGGTSDFRELASAITVQALAVCLVRSGLISQDDLLQQMTRITDEIRNARHTVYLP